MIPRPESTSDVGTMDGDSQRAALLRVRDIPETAILDGTSPVGLCAGNKDAAGRITVVCFGDHQGVTTDFIGR